MSTPIQVSCSFDSATRKRDKSVSLRFTTNTELTTDEFMEMDKRVQHTGWLVWADNELQDADIPTGLAPEREGKPKGQRMRAVFFLIWKKRGIEESFDAWYDRQFERLLDRYKEELD